MPDLLNTRLGKDAARLEGALRERAPGPWRSVPCPLIGFEPAGVAVPLGAIPIFTSAKGVLSASPGTGPAWCVGPRTAEVARGRGWAARIGGGTADALLEAVLAVPPEGFLLHVRGEHARGDLAARLRDRGRDAREVVAYRQPFLPLSDAASKALSDVGTLVVPLLSPRAGAHFGQIARNARAPLHIVALSAAVAEAWGGPVAALADRPEIEALAVSAAPLLVAGGARG